MGSGARKKVKLVRGPRNKFVERRRYHLYTIDRHTWCSRRRVVVVSVFFCKTDKKKRLVRSDEEDVGCEAHASADVVLSTVIVCEGKLNNLSLWPLLTSLVRCGYFRLDIDHYMKACFVMSRPHNSSCCFRLKGPHEKVPRLDMLPRANAYEKYK